MDSRAQRMLYLGRPVVSRNTNSGDLSVIGFDDAYIAQVSDLTTVRQDPVELGHKAAIKALGLMRGETLGHPHESIAPELVLRETTGRPR